jgi:hypothetical protein
MDLVVFEENKPLVVEALENGDFDYIEAASEYVETEFFRYIGAEEILSKLAGTYPSPREKQEVPLWLYVAANLSMRLHGVDAFHAFPMVVCTGGMINAFAGKLGRKATHPDTGDMTLSCEGFNRKNHYDRQSPCDQDFLRKMARDTDARALMKWYNTDVVTAFKDRHVYDREGIFIGDASYIFVPDNPNYEGSVKLLFDEHNHPISKKDYDEMPGAQRAQCKWRRCYKMVTLLHTNGASDMFVFVGVRIVSGKDHECPILYEMVDDFVGAVGPGVMKRLIMDRGFLDGAAISHCKRDHGIDVLIPVRRGMDIYVDATALFERPEVEWFTLEEPVPEKKTAPRPRPKAVERREKKRQETLKEREREKPPPPPERVVVKREAAVIGGFSSWSACTVPLNVVANRDHYADGHTGTWLLLDTREVRDPREVRLEYRLRTAVEERYRQLKCFSDLTHFTSRALSLVVNQIVFVLLAYSLLQIYLVRKKRDELNKKTLPHIRRQILPSDNYLIVCWNNYYGLFDTYEYTEFILSLGEEARKKIVQKSRRMRRQLQEDMANLRGP